MSLVFRRKNSDASRSRPFPDDRPYSEAISLRHLRRDSGSGDFRDEAVVAAIRAALGGPADIVLSDMAAPATGHAATDHLRVVALAEDAFALAQTLLKPGGTFVAKVFQSGADAVLLAQLKRDFSSVKHVKPASSRTDSSERYVLAMGFRGVPTDRREADTPSS